MSKSILERPGPFPGTRTLLLHVEKRKWMKRLEGDIYFFFFFVSKSVSFFRCVLFLFERQIFQKEKYRGSFSRWLLPPRAAMELAWEPQTSSGLPHVCWGWRLSQIIELNEKWSSQDTNLCPHGAMLQGEGSAYYTTTLVPPSLLQIKKKKSLNKEGRKEKGSKKSPLLTNDQCQVEFAAHWNEPKYTSWIMTATANE